MNLISVKGRDFWRGRSLFAYGAWMLSRVCGPMGKHFDRVFRRRLMAFHAVVEQMVEDAPRPDVEWHRVLSSARPVGDFFLGEDETAPEIGIVNDVCIGKTPAKLWTGRLTGRFPFDPRHNDAPGYVVRDVAHGQRFTYAAGRPLRWIMLISKKPLPPVYALEFDYTPHTRFREQLQFDFKLRSLHQRLRFMLRHNERFVFSAIDGGFFAPDSRSVPFSFKIGETARVRFEIARDIFALLVDGSLVMSVRMSGVGAEVDERCALIFYDQEPDILIDCEVANLVYEEP